MVKDRIDRAVAQGEFKPETDSIGLARYLGAIIQGMSVQAQDGATKSQLLRLVQLVIRTLRQSVA